MERPLNTTEESRPRAKGSWLRRFLFAAVGAFSLFVVSLVVFGWELPALFSLLTAFLCLLAALFAWFWRLVSRFGLWGRLALILAVLSLASYATHNFLTLALRAKSAEASANLKKLQRSQIHYHRKHGLYRAARRAPEPDTEGRLMWPDPLPEGSGWAALGWHLVGVRSWCQYEVVVQGETFTARAYCDVDQNGEVGVFEVSKEGPPRRLTPHY